VPESAAARYVAHQALHIRAEKIAGNPPDPFDGSFKPDPAAGSIQLTDATDDDKPISYTWKDFTFEQGKLTAWTGKSGPSQSTGRTCAPDAPTGTATAEAEPATARQTVHHYEVDPPAAILGRLAAAVHGHLAAQTPVIALRGTGRATDDLTRAPSRDGLIVVDVTDPGAVAAAVREKLPPHSADKR
jgi:hypothetical protein